MPPTPEPDMPADLLHAVAECQGRVVLVVGAGCSIEQPTGLKLVSEYAGEVLRKLVLDGILAGGDCDKPQDLSLVASAVWLPSFPLALRAPDLLRRRTQCNRPRRRRATLRRRSLVLETGCSRGTHRLGTVPCSRPEGRSHATGARCGGQASRSTVARTLGRVVGFPRWPVCSSSMPAVSTSDRSRGHGSVAPRGAGPQVEGGAAVARVCLGKAGRTTQAAGPPRCTAPQSSLRLSLSG